MRRSAMQIGKSCNHASWQTLTRLDLIRCLSILNTASHRDTSLRRTRCCFMMSTTRTQCSTVHPSSPNNRIPHPAPYLTCSLS
jgi:hypothetical protein